MSYDTRDIVEDVKKVIESSNLFEKVSYSNGTVLTQEEIFPACYINLHTNTFNSNGKNTTGLDGYDSMLLVTLDIYLNQGDDQLNYLDIQDSLVREMLKDTKLWRYTLDRDIKVASWDFNENYPKKEGNVTFEFKLRLCNT